MWNIGIGDNVLLRLCGKCNPSIGITFSMVQRSLQTTPGAEVHYWCPM
jgi:hypothetical protein